MDEKEKRRKNKTPWGISRVVDCMGRVVIPTSIRKKMDICPGDTIMFMQPDNDTLEICVERTGEREGYLR